MERGNEQSPHPIGELPESGKKLDSKSLSLRRLGRKFSSIWVGSFTERNSELQDTNHFSWD